MIEKALAAVLAGNNQVAALTGGGTEIYPNRAPQDAAFPYLVYYRAAGARIMTLAGPSGVCKPTVKIEGFGLSYAQVKPLAEAVRGVLHCFKGPVTVGGRTFQVSGVFFEQEDEEYIAPVHADELGYQVISQDYSVWFLEN